MGDKIGGAKFPLNTGDYKSRITFHAIKVIPPSIAVRFEASQSANEQGVNGNSDTVEKPNKPAGVQGQANSMKVVELENEKVELHLPLSYQVNDTQDYSTASLGIAGAGLMAGANKGDAIGEAAFQAVKDGFSSIGDLFKSGAVSRVALVRGAQAVPIIPQGVKSALSIAGRVAMNPNLRAQYNGPNIREFNFTFKLFPKSADESEQAKKVIRFFRFHSYPDQIAPNIAYDYPNLFRIKLQSKGTDNRYKHVGTPIKLCYLKVVSVNYNPTSTVLHADGSPTEIDINLTFTEYKPLNRDDVRYENNSIFYQYEGYSAQAEQEYNQQNGIYDPAGDTD